MVILTIRNCNMMVTPVWKDHSHDAPEIVPASLGAVALRARAAGGGRARGSRRHPQDQGRGLRELEGYGPCVLPDGRVRSASYQLAWIFRRRGLGSQAAPAMGHQLAPGEVGAVWTGLE